MTVSLPWTGPEGSKRVIGERLDELLERHAVLQADRDRDREAVHERAEGSAFLVHVDEDLAELAVDVLAGPEIDLVAADRGLLGVALASVRQALTLDRSPGDLLGDLAGCALRRRRFGNRVVLVIVDIVAECDRGQAAATASSRLDRAPWP